MTQKRNTFTTFDIILFFFFIELFGLACDQTDSNGIFLNCRYTHLLPNLVLAIWVKIYRIYT